MNDQPLHALTARELAARVAAGVLSAVEVARYFIERVQRLNPALNAIVQFDPALVLEEAASVDRRQAAGESLPMAGVPFTVKDNLWVAGRRIAQGSRLFEDFVAPRDAWAVARLRERGAVVLGITNCSEFACKGVSTNLLYGATRHPADPALTPGGSSGGAAAALAAGLGLLALGTDAGGSTRRPAAHTGLVGLKPSPGLIPHPWGFAEPNYGLSVIGALAGNVGDCAWLYDQLLAYDAGDPAGVPIAVALQAGPALAQAPPRSLRLAWSPRLGCDFAIDADVLAVLQQRVDALRAQGWNIVDADPAWPAGPRGHAAFTRCSTIAASPRARCPLEPCAGFRWHCRWWLADTRTRSYCSSQRCWRSSSRINRRGARRWSELAAKHSQEGPGRSGLYLGHTIRHLIDLAPCSRTRLKLVKSVTIENDGYEESSAVKLQMLWILTTSQDSIDQWNDLLISRFTTGG